MPWDDNLDKNSVAYAIAADQSRYIRVLAGPGTGKSFALKRRVARLLESAVIPARLLPVTFTNVAAEDLQRELLQIGTPGCEDIRAGTLHSACMRILARQHVLQAIGRISRPLNRFEMEPLLQDLPVNFGNKRGRAKRIRAYEAAWARLQHDTPGFALAEEDREFEHQLVAWLRFHQGMLIGEIIPLVYQYLRDNPAAPERHLYDHILVDEYQDLNRAEQAVIDMLAQNAHICAFGDDDQSLYSFKYAHPAGIRAFPGSHMPTVDHAILECRRCPTRVVKMANALIAHNKDRDPRQLTPRNANGQGDVRILQYSSLANEAIGIAEIVTQLINEHGYQPKDILILAQRRSVGNPIHDALEGRNIPSKSFYHEGALDSLQAQERMALLKLIVNEQDHIALRWLLGFGSNDFRRNAYARVRDFCDDSKKTPWDLMCEMETKKIQIPYTGVLVKRFREIKLQLDTLRESADITEFVENWLGGQLAETDLFRALVLELAPLVNSFEELFEALLNAVAQPEIPPDVTQVRIMSLHKSKGLSAPVVIVAGCVEGLLPTAPDPDLTLAENNASLEEQRRLFYVGLTRCKSDPACNQPGTLILTSSRTMGLADAMQSGISPARVVYATAYVHASRFMRELGPGAPAAVAG